MIERTVKASHNHETLKGSILRVFDETGKPLALDGVVDVTTFTDGYCIIMKHKDGATGAVPEWVFLMGDLRVEVLPSPWAVEDALLKGEPIEDTPPVGILDSGAVV